ncbi:hypothetical protein ACFL4H_00355 [Candidatus Neomarinimicrobiota bacterium]
MNEWFKKNAYNLILTVVIAIFTVGGLWVKINYDIKILDGNIILVGQTLDKHLEDIASSPLSSLELTNEVGHNKEDIVDVVKAVDEMEESIQENHDNITTIKTMQGVIRGDQKEMKSDIKEILKLVKANGN